MTEQYAYSDEEGFFVDMSKGHPDYPNMGTELTTSDVLKILNSRADLLKALEKFKEDRNNDDISTEETADNIFLIVRDGWIPDKYFEDNEQEKAEKYLRWCRYAYRGSFELRRCNKDHPRRFMKAILEV